MRRSAPATIASPIPSTSWIRLRRDDSSWIARSRAAPSRTLANSRALANAVAIWFANVVHSSSSSGVQSYGRAVVQHQEADPLVAEQQRDEVDGPEPEPLVDRPEVGCPGGIGQHHRAPLADRAQAQDVVVLGDDRDGVDQVAVEGPAGDELERLAAGLQLPDPGGVGAEQLLRRVEDVLEDRVELEGAVDLGDDPPQRDRARLPGVTVRPADACGTRSIAGRVVLPVGLGPPGRTALAVRRGVVQGECHATGRGYPPAGALRYPVAQGVISGCVGTQRTRACPVRTIGRSYPLQRGPACTTTSNVDVAPRRSGAAGLERPAAGFMTNRQLVIVRQLGTPLTLPNRCPCDRVAGNIGRIEPCVASARTSRAGERSPASELAGFLRVRWPRIGLDVR